MNLKQQALRATHLLDKVDSLFSRLSLDAVHDGVYVEQQGGQFTAVCVNLGLAAQGSSKESATSKLGKQIESYIYDAERGIDKEFKGQLLSRKATLMQILKYHYACAKEKVKCLAG